MCEAGLGQRLPSCHINSLRSPRLVDAGGHWGMVPAPQA